MLRYEHYRDPQEALRIRLGKLTGSRVRYGSRRMTALLKRECCEVSVTRIYRLFAEEGVIVRTGRRKDRAQRQRVVQRIRSAGFAAKTPQRGSGKSRTVSAKLSGPDAETIDTLASLRQRLRQSMASGS